MEKISFCTYQTMKKDQFVSEHSHQCWEFVYYKNCSGKSSIKGEEFNFNKNTFAILPPNSPHNELHYKNGSLIFIGFYSSLPKVTAGIYDDTPYRTLEQLADLILTECQFRFADSTELLEHLLHALIIQLNRLQSPTQSHPSELSYAKRFIDENFNWKINFIDLAKSCGFTFDTFRRNFKKKYGVSPKTYLINRRLEKAKNLLENSEENCTQIAYECGFSDSAQFSTMFRNKYGTSPKKFLNKQKKHD